jgi:hypothetical protein
MDPHNNNGRRRRRERERERERERKERRSSLARALAVAAAMEVARLPADRHKHKNLETKQRGHMIVDWHTIDAHAALRHWSRTLNQVFVPSCFLFFYLF